MLSNKGQEFEESKSGDARPEMDIQKSLHRISQLPGLLTRRKPGHGEANINRREFSKIKDDQNRETYGWISELENQKTAESSRESRFDMREAGGWRDCEDADGHEGVANASKQEDEIEDPENDIESSEIEFEVNDDVYGSVICN